MYIHTVYTMYINTFFVVSHNTRFKLFYKKITVQKLKSGFKMCMFNIKTKKLILKLIRFLKITSINTSLEYVK